MTERFSQAERPSRSRQLRERLYKHQVLIGSALSLAPVLYLGALNRALGVNNDINPITVTEIGLVGLSASFFAGAIRTREKPSDFIKDVLTLTKSILDKHQH